eukprot:6183767-Pleurochrysis_carterae.AAC.1
MPAAYRVMRAHLRPVAHGYRLFQGVCHTARDEQTASRTAARTHKSLRNSQQSITTSASDGEADSCAGFS